MKFCKNLQQIVEISDPEWAPYWTNYKMLKKLIKELPSRVPVTESTDTEKPKVDCMGTKDHKSNTPTVQSDDAPVSSVSSMSQQHKETRREDMGKSPGEIAFFKFLHLELKKTVKFFGSAQKEFSIREQRVRDGMEIMRSSNSIMCSDRWSTMAKSIYRLYKDVLLLELYAIMTYCSFSKILKKHDKTTGYSTRIAFMSNMVNKANFTSYPDLLAMISRCETLFEEVSQKLLIEGNSALCDDERLFLSMIHRFYGQMTEKAKEEGDPNTHSREEVLNKRQAMTVNFSVQSRTPGFQDSSKNASSLRSLVEENEKRKNCLSDDQDEQSESSELATLKRPLSDKQNEVDTKRQKTETNEL